MAAIRTLLVVYCLILHTGVISAAKLNVVRYFEVAESESDLVAQLNQTHHLKPVAGNAVQPPVTDKTVRRPVVYKAKDAVGLYKLSYEDYSLTWEQFKVEHKRVYNSADEEKKRFAIFMHNVKIIERHNWQFHNGLTTYWMKINKFSDWSKEELDSFLTPIIVNETAYAQATPQTMNVSLPDRIDWRETNCVTDVKDMLSCRSSYAFSTTGSLECQWQKKTGNLVDLSEQQLVDCSGRFGNSGCKGGNVESAFKYLTFAGGIESEDTYPYLGKEGPCQLNSANQAFPIKGYKKVNPANSEPALKTAVGNIGTISVAFAATRNFFNFAGGIFKDETCGDARVNYAALVVGYDSEDFQDYWIVKNSLGTSYGDEGYINFARNNGNMCKIASAAIYPLV